MANINNIGLLTGGGDCPGLNAVIRAVVKKANGSGLRTWGIQNGFGGLVNNQITELDENKVSGILARGGTILGTTNRDNPFHFRTLVNGRETYSDRSAAAVDNLEKAAIEALIVIGGDGSIRIGADFITRHGIKIVAVPKTIDNDIPATERTFGFDTALAVATDALDRLHTTAESHHRVMILEVMGRYAGWIALHSGIAGGADGILIPEIPYRLEAVLAKIYQRRDHGKCFSIIVIAEGAAPVGGAMTGVRAAAGSDEPIRLGGVGEKLARDIEERTGIECRCTVLGHLQRGGSPTAYDRVLATGYGVAAVNCLLAGKFGRMVALRDNKIIDVPITEIASHTKTVQPNNELLLAGRGVGVCFGD